MKSLTILLLVAAAGLPALAAAGPGVSNGHDLDALWARAEAGHDLAREDAVVLLDDLSVTVAADGTIATRLHTVVWIGTAQGIRHYADLRVPWNAATSTLDVELLRTWRDDRWWPDAARISETAVVHTLPYAVRAAPDYADLRETMLLHDGIELPCLVETAYTITERGRPVADGSFGFRVADPAVRIARSVSLPAGGELVVDGRFGAPAAQRDGASWTWVAEDAPPHAWPVAGDVRTYEPTVFWSAGADAAAAGRAWSDAFEAAVAGYDADALAPDLGAAVAGAAGGVAEVRAVLGFLRDTVRPVGTAPAPWRFRPRTAARTWDTAYGHVLDRAVLATAVLRGLGWRVAPRFAVEDAASVDHALELGRLVLVVDHAGDASALIVDAATGALGDGADAAALVDPAAATTAISDAPASDFALVISLAPGKEGAWQGTGRLATRGLFATAAPFLAGGDGVRDHVAAVVGSVLPDATVDGVNVRLAGPGRHEVEFAVTVPAPEGDEMRFVVGSPAGGLPAALPHDVNVADAARQSPIAWRGAARQSVTLRLDLGGRTVVHRPADRDLSADSGLFQAVTTADDDRLTFRRELTLVAARAPEHWPSVRGLLLAETDAAAATIVLGPASAAD
ncbi:DUF3857 domain-containing protein [bacterium]|nr:DUF3857 domain-containing protein [bacterium]